MRGKIWDAWHWMPEEFRALVPGIPPTDYWHDQMEAWEGRKAAFDREFPAFRARIEKVLLLRALERGRINSE